MDKIIIALLEEMKHSSRAYDLIIDLSNHYENFKIDSCNTLLDHYNIPEGNLCQDEDGECGSNDENLSCRDYYYESISRAMDGEITFDELHKLLTNWDS